MSKMYEAGKAYLDLQSRATNPDGRFDNAGRFWPTQEFDCCGNIRRPSRNWPYSLLAHARSAEHVGKQFDMTAAEVRRAAYLVKNEVIVSDELETAILTADRLKGSLMSAPRSLKLINKFQKEVSHAA